MPNHDDDNLSVSSLGDSFDEETLLKVFDACAQPASPPQPEMLSVFQDTSPPLQSGAASSMEAFPPDFKRKYAFTLQGSDALHKGDIGQAYAWFEEALNGQIYPTLLEPMHFALQNYADSVRQISPYWAGWAETYIHYSDWLYWMQENNLPITEKCADIDAVSPPPTEIPHFHSALPSSPFMPAQMREQYIAITTHNASAPRQHSSLLGTYKNTDNDERRGASVPEPDACMYTARPKKRKCMSPGTAGERLSKHTRFSAYNSDTEQLAAQAGDAGKYTQEILSYSYAKEPATARLVTEALLELETDAGTAPLMALAAKYCSENDSFSVVGMSADKTEVKTMLAKQLARIVFERHPFFADGYLHAMREVYMTGRDKIGTELPEYADRSKGLPTSYHINDKGALHRFQKNNIRLFMRIRKKSMDFSNETKTAFPVFTALYHAIHISSPDIKYPVEPLLLYSRVAKLERDGAPAADNDIMAPLAAFLKEEMAALSSPQPAQVPIPALTLPVPSSRTTRPRMRWTDQARQTPSSLVRVVPQQPGQNTSQGFGAMIQEQRSTFISPVMQR